MSYVRIWKQYLEAQGAKVALLALALLGSIVLQLLSPQIVRRFIDGAAAGADLALLSRLAVYFLIAAVANQGLAALAAYLGADIGWRATNRLRADLFRHALGLDMQFHKERSPGTLIERIDGDVTHLSNFFSQFAVRVVGALLLVGGILVLLWLEDWRAGLALTLYVLAAVYVLVRRREVAVPATQVQREANATVFGFIEERLSGIEDIRANGAGAHVMRRLGEVHEKWFKVSRRAWNLQVSVFTAMVAFSSVGYVGILALGVWLYLKGAVTLGAVYLFFNYMTMLEDPLDAISQQMQEFQHAGAGARRAMELLAERPRIADGDGAGGDRSAAQAGSAGGDRAAGQSRAAPGVPGAVEAGAQGAVTAGERLVVAAARAHAIEFDNVSFSYDDQPVLKNISFRLEPGQTLGLLGRTGSGKTTLVRLLVRLYDPTSGRILLDGIDTRKMKLAELRRAVGYVTQEVQLFSGSVRDNLTLFDRQIPDERLHEALEELGLDEWINKLPQGLDTVLGANGGGLSAGESQLLAFARLLLQDPGVVVMDEPTSRLDPATERFLTRATERLLRGRTGIVIAHRLETIRSLDSIMILANGEIAEFGPQAALAGDPGSLYRALLDLSADAGLDEQFERLGV